MIRRSSTAIAAVIPLIGFGPTPGSAQQALDLGLGIAGMRNFAGAAVGSAPEYIGSDDYTIGIAPATRVHWDSSERFIRLIATELAVNVIDSPSWSFGPLGNFRFARKGVPDAAVDRMENIDPTVEFGVFGGWRWISTGDPRQRFDAALQVQHDVGGVHQGYLVTPAVRYWHPVSQPITVSLGVAATYGSKSYISTYFDVNATDAARSGLRPFAADSGFRDVRLSPIVIYSLSEKWHLGAGVIYSRLVGDAADSPVTTDRGDANQLFGGFGVVYAW